MNMKKLGIVFILCIILCGCAGQGQPMSTSENYGGYEVTKLFTVDSITVYRFYDDGRFHYFTSQGRVMITRSNGKQHWSDEID